jgi:hypothetical protein
VVEATDDGPVDVSIVIVSYHCRDQVLACVDSITAADSARRVETIVVDNGSDDGTVEALADRADGVQVVPMGYNSGFAKASNVGIHRSRGRNVLLLNPDTVVAPGSLDGLADWLGAHGSAGVAAPRLVNPDGSSQRTARSFPTPAAALFGRRSPLTRWFPGNRWSSRYLSGRDHPEGEPFRTDWVSGAAMMVPASVIGQVGALDEEYFLFWEDADWCRRIVDAGFDVWCVPAAVITHDEGGTRAHGWSSTTVRHFHRGAYLYWRKHHAPQAWNPLRWAGAGLLATRAAAVAGSERLRGRRAAPAEAPATSRTSVPIPNAGPVPIPNPGR